MSDCASEQFDTFLQSLRGGVGASAGTLISLCLLTGNSPVHMLNKWKESQDFHESSFCVAPNFDLNLLYSEFGLDRGDNLRTIIETTLQFCGLHDDITLKQLHTLTAKRFVLCITDLTHQERVLMDHTSHPGTRLADALFMSMTLPLLIKPMELNGSIMVDGGMMSNEPTDVFPIEETLCLAVDTAFTLLSRPKVKFSNFLYAIIRTTLAVQSRHTIRDPEATICVEVTKGVEMGIKMTEKEMCASEATGYAAAMLLVARNAVEACGELTVFISGMAFCDLSSKAGTTGDESFSDENAN